MAGTHLRQARVVRRLLAKETDPRVAVQSIAPDDKVELLLRPICEDGLHFLLVLLNRLQLVPKAHFYAELPRKVDERMREGAAPHDARAEPGVRLACTARVVERRDHAVVFGEGAVPVHLVDFVAWNGVDQAGDLGEDAEAVGLQATVISTGVRQQM